MPQSSCVLNESGAGEATLFSMGYEKLYLHFFKYFSCNFDKISYRDVHKYLLNFVKIGAVKKHA
jgi:hypothetical protein